MSVSPLVYEFGLPLLFVSAPVIIKGVLELKEPSTTSSKPSLSVSVVNLPVASILSTFPSLLASVPPASIISTIPSLSESRSK